MSVKHIKVSTIADGSDTDLVRPSDWNDEHNVALTDADIPATIARDAEVTAEIATHAALPTVHQDAPALITTHSALDTGVHGAGGDVLATDADIATHTADIDAHQGDILLQYKVGEYFTPFPVAYASLASSIGANAGVLIPFFVNRNMTIDRLAVEITTGDAGNLGRLGIYNSGVDLVPSSLVLDGGAFSIAAVGVIAVTIDQALTNGLYWLHYTSDGNATLRWAMPAVFPHGQFATVFNHIRRQFALLTAGTGSGALADPCPATTLYSYARQVLICPRLKSLD